MTRQVSSRVLLPALAAVLLFVETAGRARSQEPITLDPAIECWYSDRFPVVGAELTLSEPPSKLRLYYRCSAFLDYYTIDFSTAESPLEYRAVAPMAEDDCPSVNYYVESVSANFTAARTPERQVDVTTADSCRRRYPGAAWWERGEPSIFSRPVRAGAPALPPGFRAAGIVTEAAGPSALTAVVVGAGAAAGVAVLVGAAGDETSPPTSTTAVALLTTTAAPTSTTTSAPSTTVASTTTARSSTSTSTTSTPPSTVSVGIPNLTLLNLSFPRPGSACPNRSTFREAVDFTIANTGNGDSKSFRIMVESFSNPVKRDFISVGALRPGEQRDFKNVLTPCGGSCFIPDCTVCVELDPDRQSGETNRSDNRLCRTSIG